VKKKGEGEERRFRSDCSFHLWMGTLVSKKKSAKQQKREGEKKRRGRKRTGEIVENHLPHPNAKAPSRERKKEILKQTVGSRASPKKERKGGGVLSVLGIF